MNVLRCIIFLLLLSGYTFAQDVVTKYSAGKLHTGTTLQHSFFLVQTLPGVKKADLKRNLIDVVRTLPNGYYIVRGNASRVTTSSHLLGQIHYANNRWKLSESLLKLTTNSENLFTVKVSDIKAFESFLSSEKVSVARVNGDVATIIASRGFILEEVIKRDEVLYVGYESHQPKEESRVLDLNLNPNNINQVHHSYPELTGEGLMLSLKELLFKIDDIDLKGRSVLNFLAAPETSNHATDMATIAAGAGNSFITGKGAATKVNITSSDYIDLNPDPASNFTSLNISTQNHSYGTVIENFYGAFAEAYDRNANDLPHLLHVFSSGNEGASTSMSGPYNGVAGYANLTGNFKMSKNTLSVGSVDTTGNSVSFVSRGPAYDGRVKPELVAYSTQGSSNSAALVSGIVILLQQAYKEEHGAIPPSALVKSLLINSADDAGAPGIDFITGYGNVNAHRAIENLKQGNYLSGAISHSEIKTFNLNIPAQAVNLKITLVWNDPAASANSTTALVNDVDMKLATSSSPVLPWVLNSSPSVAQLSQPATRARDGLNNVEQITLANPESGVHTISIEGFDIPRGPQEFFITYQWDIANSFTWEFPTGSDNFPYNGETGTYFYWKSTFPDASGILEYSTDNGATWIEITPNAQLQKGYYRWKNPPQVFTVAQARMKIGASVFPTENFTISYTVLPRVGFNCPDSVMIKWDPVEGINTYDVFKLGDQEMEFFTTTSDTAVIIYKAQNQIQDYAVQPRLAGGYSAIRSPAINYESFGVGCFLLSFYDETVAEDGIYLNTLLGTIYGVEQVVFEREENGSFVVIGTVEAGESELIRFLDEEPNQGTNRYRARIQFVNGEEIITEVIENFFLTKIPFAVFPNPVSSSEELMIFSKIFTDQNYTFSLFKTDGSIVSILELTSDREFIPLEGIPAGMYIYHLTSEEGNFIGKLFVK